MRRGSRRAVTAQLREHFRPEFLNRVDEIIVFQPLDKAQLRRSSSLLAANVTRRLTESEITLELTDAALTLLARDGYDPEYGARPLRRAIQRRLENPLAGASLPASSPRATSCASTFRQRRADVDGSVEPATPRRASVLPGASTSIN